MFLKILICHSPNGLRAVTDNLQRLVGVLAAEVKEEKRLSCKRVVLTWAEQTLRGGTPGSVRGEGSSVLLPCVPPGSC